MYDECNTTTIPLIVLYVWIMMSNLYSPSSSPSNPLSNEKINQQVSSSKIAYHGTITKSIESLVGRVSTKELAKSIIHAWKEEEGEQISEQVSAKDSINNISYWIKGVQNWIERKRNEALQKTR